VRPRCCLWESKLNDAAGKYFGVAFAKNVALQLVALQSIEDRIDAAAAYQQACTAVLYEHESGQLDTGYNGPTLVQKFQLVDPDSSRVDPSTKRVRCDSGGPPGFLAAGVPKHLQYKAPVPQLLSSTYPQSRPPPGSTLTSKNSFQLVNIDELDGWRPKTWSRQPSPRDVHTLHRVWYSYTAASMYTPIEMLKCVTDKHDDNELWDQTILKRPEEVPSTIPAGTLSLRGEFPRRRTSFEPKGRCFFMYGEMVAVERESGDTVMGRVESNEHGRALRDWFEADVQAWLEQKGLAHGKIWESLQHRQGATLLRSPSLIFKDLSEADRKELGDALEESFSFELQDPEGYLSLMPRTTPRTSTKRPYDWA